MMHPWFNDVTVPSRDWLTNPPTLSTSGNDTIKSVWCYDSAQFVVNKPATDTLTFSGDTYQNGMLVVESGIIHYTGGYVRLDHKNAGVTLKGTSKFLHEFTGGFIMGNADDGARGGQVVIQDDAYMYVDHFWRWALDSLQSVITIRDNGLLELYKDKRSDVATRVARNQIKSDEGFIIQYALKVVGEDTTTVVTAKSEVAFDITPLTAQYIGVNSPSSTLSCVNDDNITSREWKYTTTSGTGYMSFNPAQTGATLEASFDAAGTYYVICEATDGNSTFVSDEAVLNVVSVEVTPADDQTIVVFEEGTTLTVAESLVPDTRDWKYSSTSGSGYAAFAPAERETTLDPLFFAEGVYYIVCVSVFDGNSITSNEVMITVTGELSDDASLSGIQLSVGELNPAFSSTTYTYAATLPSGTTTVTVTATPTDANATVAGDGDIDVSSGSGTANIVVTAQDGTTTQPYTVNFTVTGIELNKLEASVYPNPTSGRVFLDVANGGDFSVVVVDITGKAVLQQEFRNGNSIQEINLTNPGIYMLKIVKDDQILTEKVVVR